MILTRTTPGSKTSSTGRSVPLIFRNHLTGWLCRHWLHKYVKIGKDVGKDDTPASMVTRACSAYANRPVFGIPGSGLVPDSVLPRTTARTALTDAARIQLQHRDGFEWLLYKDLGKLVRQTARGLTSLGMEPGSRVAIAGYNEIEWMVADFAIAAAGFVSVGVHTTYDQTSANAVINKVFGLTHQLGGFAVSVVPPSREHEIQQTSWLTLSF